MAEDIRNLITPEGLERFQQELTELQAERHVVCGIVSWAAGNGDRSENGDYIYNKQRLRQIDRRSSWLGRRLENATVVRPEQQSATGKVRFGSTVTYIDEDDRSHKVRIVGYDEADMARGEISIGAPVARALMGKAAGDGVEVETPEGVKYLDIEDVT
ncbi:transcription elongation factor GreB [Pelagibius litoralis]|uniref:Transcription elongation factor GreA n=1 Tax=Pelagibius litoralis TaxID=374515 RepID=A0A967F209_9PROT|nr:GreA/GreB family elongation factor [Pelagibius litoralis]NIA71630.1 transcription elongation factor GreB [Pelagibius litoralis]